MSIGWSLFVIFLTTISMVGCFWLLQSTRAGQVPNGEKVEKDHVFDGIRELETPLPAWWYWMFVITIVFSAIYLVFYPGMGAFKGLLGWTQEEQWAREVARAEARFGPIYEEYLAMPVEALLEDEQAHRMGQRLFSTNCATCHGTGGAGAFGFPNLADANWQWGSAPATVSTTITKGRIAAMPPWEAVLGEDGIHDTTHYVLSLSGREHEAAAAERGRTHFTTLCASCHMPDGTGMTALGAPNLTDDVWLYGGSEAMIKHTLRVGRNGQMPAHEHLLDPARIHLLVAYVIGLARDAAEGDGNAVATTAGNAGP
jgi:cytochrome c oxidase cbb3-type subunit 3